MVTLIKQPIYLSIETDNIDRGKVTKATNEILYPRLLEFLSNAKFRSAVIKEFNEAIGTSSTIKLLTEVDVLRKITGQSNDQ